MRAERNSFFYHIFFLLKVIILFFDKAQFLTNQSKSKCPCLKNQTTVIF